MAGGMLPAACGYNPTPCDNLSHRGLGPGASLPRAALSDGVTSTALPASLRRSPAADRA
jgi:hypothetical protein